MTLHLPRDTYEFAKLLVEQNVEFLIVGGYAVAHHGFPRYTADIDFFVAVNEANASKLVAAFDAFVGPIGLDKEDFLREWSVVELGREPNKIQVLTAIDGVDFEQCHRNAVEVVSDGLTLKVIGYEELVANKMASGRTKDLLDVAELAALRKIGLP
jgi:predicted nucleotidyltransferase